MTGILFIARLGSTRLPNKHLIECGGKPFIEWLIARFASQFEVEIEKGTVKLFIATSERTENHQFENVLKDLPVTVFYGNDENIPMRQYECAEKYNLKSIISIDGDDILCSTVGARKVYDELENNQDALIKTSGLPIGMNVMGYSTAFLSETISNYKGKLETGWGRIFDKKKSFEITTGGFPFSESLRLTLDYELDADFFKTVILHFGERIISIDDYDLINTTLENGFEKINNSLSKEYWINFNNGKNSELKDAEGI